LLSSKVWQPTARVSVSFDASIAGIHHRTCNELATAKIQGGIYEHNGNVKDLSVRLSRLGYAAVVLTICA